MRGTKAKKLRNAVSGNPLQRDKRPYNVIRREAGGKLMSVTVITAGARRAYRVSKAFASGAHPRPPLF